VNANLYLYQDETYDGNTIQVFATVDTDYSGGGAQLSVDVSATVESDGSNVGSSSGSGFPSVNVVTDGPLPAPSGDPPELQVSDGGTSIVVLVVAQFLVAGVVNKIISWFSRTSVGVSFRCYQFVQDLGNKCGYGLIQGCNVKCAAQHPLFEDLKLLGTCAQRIWNTVPWVKKGSALKCGRITVHSHPPTCYCLEIKVK